MDGWRDGDHFENSSVDVSVVIPALNVAATLGEQLEALSNQDFDGRWEVVIADNGSTDATRSVPAEFEGRLPSLQVVDASHRRGVNAARNAGAAVAKGDLILFCDGDDIVSPGWISAMAVALAEHDGVGGPIQRFGRPDFEVELDPVTQRTSLLPYPIGANCGVRRSVWADLGGFDEDYDGGAHDEAEFFWRLQLAGFTLGSANRAVVRYRMSAKPDLRKDFRKGREAVRLYRDFGYGGGQSPWIGVIKSVAWLMLRAPVALVASKRTWWLKKVARQFGRVVGTVKYR